MAMIMFFLRGLNPMDQFPKLHCSAAGQHDNVWLSYAQLQLTKINVHLRSQRDMHRQKCRLRWSAVNVQSLVLQQLDMNLSPLAGRRTGVNAGICFEEFLLLLCDSVRSILETKSHRRWAWPCELVVRSAPPSAVASPPARRLRHDVDQQARRTLALLFGEKRLRGGGVIAAAIGAGIGAHLYLSQQEPESKVRTFADMVCGSTCAQTITEGTSLSWC